MRLLVLLIGLLLSAPCMAQEVPSPDSPPIEAIPPGKDRIVSIRKGQPAPFDGQLFDIETAIRWGNWLQQYRYRLEWDVKKEQKTCTAELKYKDTALKIEKERAAAVEKDLSSRLLRAEKARIAAEEEARNPAWYSTRTFGLVMGVVATSIIFGVAVAAVGEASIAQ